MDKVEGRIYLTEEWYIDSDPLNFILKHNKLVRDKNGTGILTGKRHEYIIGYFRDIDACIERFVLETEKSAAEHFHGTIKEYADVVREELKTLQNTLEHTLKAQGIEIPKDIRE